MKRFIPIRSKLLLLLSAIALAPALGTAALDIQLLRSLSGDLTSRNAEALAQQALDIMERAASNYADTLARDARRIELLVNLQAEEMQRLLSEGEAGPGPVYTALDFDRRPEVVGATPNKHYRTAQSAEDPERPAPPLPVSWDHQGIFRKPSLLMPF